MKPTYVNGGVRMLPHWLGSSKYSLHVFDTRQLPFAGRKKKIVMFDVYLL